MRPIITIRSMMKTIKYFSILFFIIFFESCDFQECVEYKISNLTESAIQLKTYIGFFETQIIDFNANESLTRLNRCDNNASTITFDYADSIAVSIDNVIKLTYYPNGEGKNIFNVDDPESWEIVESRSGFTKKVFFIREEDIALND